MKNREAIIATVAYADIFDFPLTLGEIHKYYQGDRRVSQDEIKRTLFSISEIESKGEFFFLKDRQDIVIKRRIRKIESGKKLQKAKIISKYLALIPTISLIAVSGSLATENAGPDDDIDFFIVSRPNTVWITRLLLNMFLMAIFQKRKKNVRNAPNKICPNMIVSEVALSIPRAARTLYIAREIVQLLPLTDKNNTYERLLYENNWITEILPNSHVYTKPQSLRYQKFDSLISKIDNFLFKLQKKHMNITTEIVNKNIAKFHPRNTAGLVLFLYQKRLVKIFGQKHAKNVIYQHGLASFKEKG